MSTFYNSYAAMDQMKNQYRYDFEVDGNVIYIHSFKAYLICIY